MNHTQITNKTRIKLTNPLPLINGRDDSDGHKFIIQSRINLIDEINDRKVTQRIIRAQDDDEITKKEIGIQIKFI